MMDSIRKAKRKFMFKTNSLGKKVANIARKSEAKAKKQLNSVAMESREAIAALKKEMMYAVKSAAESAKADLKLAVRAAARQFTALQAQSAKLAKKNSAQQK